MSEESKNGAHEAQGELAASSGTPPAKKTKLNEESLEDRDFDEETQKASEEIDATQNEIDVFNEKASEEILKTQEMENQGSSEVGAVGKALEEMVRLLENPLENERFDKAWQVVQCARAAATAVRAAAGAVPSPILLFHAEHAERLADAMERLARTI